MILDVKGKDFLVVKDDEAYLLIDPEEYEVVFKAESWDELILKLEAWNSREDLYDS